MTVISNRARQLTLFLFVALAFGLVAWRGEVNTDGIRRAEHDSKVRTYTNCRIILANANNLAAVIDQILVSVKSRRDLTPAQKEVFIKTYSAARPVGPDCGPDPR